MEWGLTIPKESPRIPPADTASVVSGYALEFYATLKGKAAKETSDKGEYTIYRGGITKEYDDLGYSRSHYGRVVKLLEHLGSIQIIQKGNPRQQTVVAIFDPPTLETLSETYHLTKPSNQRKMGSTLEGRVDHIERRIGKDIVYTTALVNIEERLRELEKRAGVV